MNKWEHIIQRFNERFSPQDFIHKSKVWGEIDFKEEIVTEQGLQKTVKMVSSVFLCESPNHFTKFSP